MNVNRRFRSQYNCDRAEIEYKEYSSGKVYRSKDIVSELNLDEQLILQGWDIEWVFKGCNPSEPLRKALENAGVIIKTI